jgi:hypothetical protein
MRPISASCFASAAHHLVGMGAAVRILASIDPRDARIRELEAEVAYLRPFAPPRPPDGYVVVKSAADLARCSIELIYKRRRLGRLVSTKVRGRVWIDPTTLPVQTD